MYYEEDKFQGTSSFIWELYLSYIILVSAIICTYDTLHILVKGSF